MRRVTQSSQTIASNSYNFNYAYNLVGGLTSITYPSLRVVTTDYDGASRIKSVRKGTSGPYYAGGAGTTVVPIDYSPPGGIWRMKLGNGLWEQTRNNLRLQPIQMGLGLGVSASPDVPFSPNDSNQLLLSYDYGSATNNGNLLSQQIQAQVENGFSLTQSYLYDNFNRIISATEGSNWSQSYGFDRYGNMAVTAGANLSGADGQLTATSTSFYNTSNNRRTDAQYDQAGNMTVDPNGKSFSYDAENRQTLLNPCTTCSKTFYTYDGEGRRIIKKTEGQNPVYFVYNAQGQLLAEYGGTASNGGTRYLTGDHLGSTRVVADSTGQVVKRYDYLPYGEEIPSSLGRASIGTYGSTDSTRQKFTAKERDNESGLDFFLARYYSGAQGRFTSSDPKTISGRRILDPQQWNMYVYTRNNPLKYYDPDGMELRLASGLDPKTQNRIIKDLVDAYRRPTGRAGLQVVERSPIMYYVGTSSLPDSEDYNHNTRRIFGITDPRAVVAGKSADGKSIATVDQSNSVVMILFDFKKRDSAQGAPSERVLTEHEFGHAVDMANDPVAALNKIEPESEKTAIDWQKQVSGEKPDMSEENAAQAVQQMLNPPPPQPPPPPHG